MNRTVPGEMQSEEVLRVKLEVLKREHGDLDAAIRAIEESRTGAGGPDRGDRGSADAGYHRLNGLWRTEGQPQDPRDISGQMKRWLIA